jgi:TRIAD3 protein (E3 ubiquitin-protein ligase RNF216)
MKRFIRNELLQHNSHYAPTHLALLASQKGEGKPNEPKVTKYNFERDRKKLEMWNDEVLEEERRWVVERARELEEGADKGKGKEKAPVEEEPELEEGEGIECQCCFSEYAFVSYVFLPYSISNILRAPFNSGKHGSVP